MVVLTYERMRNSYTWTGQAEWNASYAFLETNVFISFLSYVTYLIVGSTISI